MTVGTDDNHHHLIVVYLIDESVSLGYLPTSFATKVSCQLLGMPRARVRMLLQLLYKILCFLKSLWLAHSKARQVLLR